MTPDWFSSINSKASLAPFEKVFLILFLTVAMNLAKEWEKQSPLWETEVKDEHSKEQQKIKFVQENLLSEEDDFA